jgi:putative ABC transport system permease protein
VAFDRWRIGRPGWVGMSARLLLRSLRLRHSSFLLALLAVTVGATVAATMLDLKADLRQKMSRELRRYGPNLLVTPGRPAESATLDEARLLKLPALLGERDTFFVMSPLLLAAGRIGRTDPASGGTEAVVVGADFRSLARQNPSWRIEGTWPGEGEGGCLLGAALAGVLKIAPGETISLAVAAAPTERLKVSGILSTGESEDDQLLVPLPFLQERAGLAGRISLAAFSVDGGPEAVRRVAAVIEREMPAASARPLWQVAAAQGAILAKLERLMLFLTLIVLLLCGLCVMTTLLSIVLEREPEIGLMRSIGAGDGEILMMFLGEVSILGILGGGAGLALGAAAARLVGSRLFGAAIEARAAVIPLVLAVSLGLCWIAVLLPLRRALAVRPAMALRGE